MTQTTQDVLDIFFEGIPEPGDVLLVTSPLYWIKTPLLSLHLLQAACQQASLTARVLYPNLLYSIITGPGIHEKIARENYYFLGERIFTAAAFGHSAVTGRINEFFNLNHLPDHTWKMDLQMVDQVSDVLTPFYNLLNITDWEHLESRTTQWVQVVAQRIADMGYRVVGCSSSPGGLVPAIALLDAIKKSNANIITILGGALCEGEMAEGILSLKTGIDYVFAGEGEITFPGFLKEVVEGHLPGEKIIYGEAVKDMDAIPVPDYDDYFDQLKKLPIQVHPSPGNIGIPYETSRGCWYGKCPFCGYYGKKNFYREKSPGRILSALKELVRRYGNCSIFMTDNIMPPHFMDTLIPRISKDIPTINFRYEIKSNLTLEQVLSLKKAGVISIEPGIESLSPSLLRRMRKGVTVRENIALLRYVRSVKLALSWFLLFGIPGEEVEEYEETLRLLPLIRHLPPPQRIISMMIFRFSPYQRFPGKFGISNLRPADVYKDILPSYADPGKIAYYFTGDYCTQADENPEIIVALAKEFQAWRKAWVPYEIIPLEIMIPALHITQKAGDEYLLEDTRGLPGNPKQRVLNQEQASILLVPGREDSSVDYQWALEAGLGFMAESTFIPLATAEPELLLEFERQYGYSKKKDKKICV